ncbi:MAG: single-stranded DNA-binding protein [Acholeplasmatales bacterium]|jgi:single-strand DNA-binding protein|nr:single-stranded DNA-binding protein [Acholeplasmatales bacterium]
MINSVVLVGRLTNDPELKKTESNISVVNFSLAVKKRFAVEKDERDAYFIPCVAWRNQAENLCTYIKKGGLIGIEGSIQERRYQDKDGNNRTVVEVLCNSIQFLENKKSENVSSNGNDYQSPKNSEPIEDEYFKTAQKITDDDVPF